MMIFSFLLQYFGMSYITADNTKYITHSLSKFYMAVIMALFMGVYEVLMAYSHTKTLQTTYFVILLGMLVVFIIFYRIRFKIYDKNYLKEMIEHHNMALFTSKDIIKKTNNSQVKQLASNIIKTQQEEIDYMENLILSPKN